MGTILPMTSQLTLYREMFALSAKMVDAASNQDWDHLIDLENMVVRLREALMAMGSEDPADNVLAAEKRLLIQRILDNDAEVRRHTEPWMEQVRTYLGKSHKGREMRMAYAIGSGEAIASQPGGLGA